MRRFWVLAVLGLGLGGCDGGGSSSPNGVVSATNGGSGYGQCCDPMAVCFVAQADSQAAFIDGCAANGGHINGWCDGNVDPVMASQAELDCLDPQPSAT